ncbi:MAG: hypothetical protein K2O52_04960 [Oscillospiraceae bacterium]|nr:hypothetical protein [Oscillospiraceae bacterium]
MMKKWYEKFHDEEFSHYIETGEATAVHIVRDLALDVDTTRKWIDVISMNTFEHPQCSRIGFNWIIVELFPRITHPQYTDDVEYNRYICWHAAHDDIALHRKKNHHGEKFLVLCRLFIKERKVSQSGEEHWVYDYKVLASHKIQQKQINYITKNENSIISQIRKKRKPVLAMFHISENI